MNRLTGVHRTLKFDIFGGGNVIRKSTSQNIFLFFLFFLVLEKKVFLPSLYFFLVYKHGVIFILSFSDDSVYKHEVLYTV